MSLLGLDVGTTGCKAAVFAPDGRCLGQAYREYETLRPRPDWMELDSLDVWRKVREVIAEAAAATGPDPVTALSISSMGESVVPLSAARRILGNTILCSDARGEEHATALERDFGQEVFYAINPNILGAQYTLPKLLWIREHQPELYVETDYFLLWGDAVAFLLGAEAVTGNILANRTLLFDLEKNDWSDTLVAWSGLDASKLAPVRSAGSVVGTVAADVAEELGLSDKVQIVVGGHDQCCNALGCGGIHAGRAVCGIGTFECITPIYRKPSHLLDVLKQGVNVEHHVLPDLFVSFIYNQGGVLVKWFRDTFAAADASDGSVSVYDRLNAEVPVAPTRLLVLPHFDKPVSPRGISDSAGAIIGLRTSTTRGEILKAIMECETLYFVESMHALHQLGISTTEFIASGGGARSDAWLQIKADVFGVPFVRPRITEAGVLGAAMLAGIATGVHDAASAVATFVDDDRVFEPDAARHVFYREKHEQYRGLYPALREISARL